MYVCYDILIYILVIWILFSKIVFEESIISSFVIIKINYYILNAISLYGVNLLWIRNNKLTSCFDEKQHVSLWLTH